MQGAGIRGPMCVRIETGFPESSAFDDCHQVRFPATSTLRFLHLEIEGRNAVLTLHGKSSTSNTHPAESYLGFQHHRRFIFSTRMLVNASQFASAELDFIIVGGGTAGLVVAAR